MSAAFDFDFPESKCVVGPGPSKVFRMVKYRPMRNAYFLLTFALLTAQAADVVEITAEPHHHLILQNSLVRVFQVEIPAGDSTLLHVHHHDYIAVHPGVTDISNTVTGKPPVFVKQPVGETHFTAGNFTHVVRNNGAATFDSIDVELQQDQGRKTPPQPWAEERGLEVLQGGTQDILFVKDGARASEIDLQPGGMIPAQAHASPHLFVAITDVDLVSHAAGQPGKIDLKPGAVNWVEAGPTPALMNGSQAGAKFILLEFH